MKKLPLFISILLSIILTGSVIAQKSKDNTSAKPASKAKPKTKYFGKKQVRFLNTEIPVVQEIQKLSKDGMHYDLPDAVADKNGRTWVTHLIWDGKKDQLVLAQ